MKYAVIEDRGNERNVLLEDGRIATIRAGEDKEHRFIVEIFESRVTELFNVARTTKVKDKIYTIWDYLYKYSKIYREDFLLDSNKDPIGFVLSRLAAGENHFEKAGKDDLPSRVTKAYEWKGV